jgi:hypothetical protein
MDDAYASFIAEVEAGGFGDPQPGQWSAVQIAAHVARNHEELIAVTEALLADEPAAYDNHEPAQTRALDAYAQQYGGLLGLADRLAVTTITLRELAARLEERGLTEVPVLIRDSGEVVVDETIPWAKVLEIDATGHLARHLAQLRALRPDAPAA